MSEASMAVPINFFRFPLIDHDFPLSNVLSIRMSNIDKKSIVSTLLSDVKNSKDIQALLPYWRAEAFLFQPHVWTLDYLKNPKQFEGKLMESVRRFWKIREPSLKLHYPRLSEKYLTQRILKLIEKILNDFARKDTEKYIGFWFSVWNNKELRQCCPEFFDMLEIFYCEAPANVFSEAMGRLTNMIQGSLKTRMGDSLVDALIRSYKNSGHLQFWESHLENIFHCHRTLMKCSSSIPVWPTRSKGSSKNSCAKVFNFDPTPPSERSSAKTPAGSFSHQRRRIQLAHKRQLVLRDIFGMEFDVLDLEPQHDIESQATPKKRKVEYFAPRSKRQKVQNEKNASDILDDFGEDDDWQVSSRDLARIDDSE